jgi:thiosulfate/3-mercaptopyruvate sulfurtransferase
MNMGPLVSATWLNEHLSDPDLVILDASIPKIGEVGPHPLADHCIPGARFFDLNGVFSDRLTDLPHNLPSPEVFTQASRQLGINERSRIVVYDHHGIYVSPRAWWMFRAMGHENVAVLNGGLPQWIASGFPTSPKCPAVELTGDFTARSNSDLICDSAWMIDNLSSRIAKVVDARSSGRFCGVEPEPRKGLKGGHIPESVNLPFDQVIRDGKFLPKEELAGVIGKLELGDGPLAFTCGSGVTACVIMLACELVLPNPKRVYDGSWSEWGQPEKKFPIAT